jgi:hypothetical protein
MMTSPRSVLAYLSSTTRRASACSAAGWANERAMMQLRGRILTSLQEVRASGARTRGLALWSASNTSYRLSLRRA